MPQQDMQKLQGSIVALVTPMKDDGAFDAQAMRDMVEWHCNEGTNALVVMGTTGESPTVTSEEYEQIVRAVVEAARGRVPVIAGCGTNCTATSVSKTLKAKALGADAGLVVTPYYNKPTQAGLIAHYKAICQAAPDFPICLYNVPGRTGCDLLPQTVATIAKECPSVFATKEAAGKIERFAELRKLCPKPFRVYSGEDCLTQEAMSQYDCDGVISVTANVAPKLMAQMCKLALARDAAEAQKVDTQALQPLHRELFCEPNPTAAKFALNKMGKIGKGIRLPLLPLTEERRAQVEAALSAAEKFSA